MRTDGSEVQTLLSGTMAVDREVDY